VNEWTEVETPDEGDAVSIKNDGYEQSVQGMNEKHIE
jgi:hypothetical protein